MRVAVVGWLGRDEGEAMELAAAQPAVSHDHPDAVAASQAVALAILLARSGLPRPELARRLANDFGYDPTESALKPGVFDISAAGTVPPALIAALTALDWEDTVRTAACFRGDNDTLACITGTVAEAAHGFPDPSRGSPGPI